ncbi:MAG: tetratricopeptide repeat protein [Brucellaceae bacterium]|nr:tetratricopeptide repeat protein [Brucellaceae bacterium]
MSDDSFIREVDEELRQDQFKSLWDRFGAYILGGAILVVLVTAAVVAYRYWDETRANAAGDAFSQALTLAEEGKQDEALAALRDLEENGYGSYPVLARLRAATVLADQGKNDEAVTDFDAVAADSSVPDSIRDMARLRAALLLADHGTYEDVAQRAEPLTSDTNPLRHTAREALGLAAWREGRTADALDLFGQLTDDEQAPRNVRERAKLMAELIRGSGAGAGS